MDYGDPQSPCIQIIVPTQTKIQVDIDFPYSKARAMNDKAASQIEGCHQGEKG